MSRLLTAPFDVIKIRFQLQVGSIAKATERQRLAYGSVWGALRKVAREEGLLGLWRCVRATTRVDARAPRDNDADYDDRMLTLYLPRPTRSGNLAATCLWIGYGAVQVGEHTPPKSVVLSRSRSTDIHTRPAVPGLRGHQGAARGRQQQRQPQPQPQPHGRRRLLGGRRRGAGRDRGHVPLGRHPHAVCGAGPPPGR